MVGGGRKVRQNFKIFVGPRLAFQHFAAVFPPALLYALTPDADLVVLPFDEELQDRLHERFGTGDWPWEITLSTSDQTFAAECSQRAPLAYLQCDDADGLSLQSAAVWRHGQLAIGPTTLDMAAAGARRAVTLRPVNVALRSLGVKATPDADEVTAFGLDAFASNADITARAWPVRE